MSASPRAVTRAVEPLFLDRWSPRAFDSSAIPQEDLDTIFDAARWAPSAFNYQPWRLLYATRDSVDWGRFLGLLMRSEEHTSELQSLMRISYAVFCLKKKKQHNQQKPPYRN